MNNIMCITFVCAITSYIMCMVIILKCSSQFNKIDDLEKRIKELEEKK